ncbi:MAG: hypothetical protein JXI33_02970 [Candidatus Aminicenantes bacterium]|nr:hypothetical protein [Candidatus Aminicenantes bacterium]
MKKAVLLLLACLVTTLLSGAVSGQVDLVSRFIWRGFDLLPENHPAVQPAISIDLGESGFCLDIWSSFALTDRAELRESDEIDLTVSYTWKPAAGWEASAGLIGYGYGFARDFSLKEDTSLEVYASLAATGLLGVPTLAVYYDCKLGQGFYASLSASHEFELNETVRVELGGLIGFNGHQYIERAGFSNIDLFVRMPLAVGRMMLVPSLNVMVPLLAEVNEDNEIWFGLTLEI